MNSVNIINDSKINTAFIKANYKLLENHRAKFVGKTNEEKKQLLKDLWLADYKAEITDTELVFSRKKDITMFLLRWS